MILSKKVKNSYFYYKRSHN